MPMWMMPPVAGLIEPAPAHEFFVEDIGALERVGTSLRAYYYTEQLPLHGGEPSRVVAVRLVWPIAKLAVARQRWDTACKTLREESFPRLVK